MQHTQNAFSFSKSTHSDPFLVGSKTPSQSSKRKANTNTKSSAKKDEDTSFGAALNQAVKLKEDSDKSRESKEVKPQDSQQKNPSAAEKENSPKESKAAEDGEPLSGDKKSLPQDEKISSEEAEQPETQQACEITVPLNKEGMISNAVLDLLASLKNGLEENGLDPEGLDLDWDALSAQMDELLGEGWQKGLVNFNIDTEQLTGILTKLRDRYAAAPAGDDSNPLNLENLELLAGDFKLVLEALLKQQDAGTAQKQGQGQKDVLEGALPLAPGANAGVSPEETAALDETAALQLSRIFSAYLKPEAQKPKAEAKKAGSETEADAEAETPAAVSADAAKAAVLLPVAGMEPQAEGNSSQLPTQSQSNPQSNLQTNIQSMSQEKSDASKSASPAEALTETLTEGLNESEKAQIGGKAEPRTNFEQFFQNVLSHRNRLDAHSAEGETFDLTKGAGSPLPQNEALREGVDNVVRFIRVSGEQKAALIVDPPALGRLTVELTNSTVGLEASIKVGSEQVRQLIQDQLSQLRWTLEQQGVQLTHFSVDVQQDNGQRSREQSEGQKNRGFVQAGAEEDEETVFRVDLNEGLLSWVA